MHDLKNLILHILCNKNHSEFASQAALIIESYRDSKKSNYFTKNVFSNFMILQQILQN